MNSDNVTTLREQLQIPAGTVLVRRVRGPAEGVHGLVGYVRLGWLYTVTTATAAQLLGDGSEFELVWPEDQAAVAAEKPAAD